MSNLYSEKSVVKRLPKALALGGAVATGLALLVGLGLETYRLPKYFRYDYMWMDCVMIPLLKVGIPAGFIGTIWWARQLNRSTRITTAIVLFLICGLMMFLPGNIHGAGALLVLTFFPVALLGVILLMMGWRKNV